ncbi:FbpB family small basic protein [Ornithinibacillus halophilus]|nr:FbpB family small basic protein [Ornithinibacillus halophilus]
MSLKKRVSYDELVQANRKQILEDKKLMEKIEENIERRIHENLQQNKEA